MISLFFRRTRTRKLEMDLESVKRLCILAQVHLSRVSSKGKGDSLMRSLLLVSLIFSCVSFAQEVTAGVYGTVFDASSSGVPRATIVLRNLEITRMMQAHTDEAGNFVLALVPIGRYDVVAEASGFRGR